MILFPPYREGGIDTLVRGGRAHAGGGRGSGTPSMGSERERRGLSSFTQLHR